MMEFRRPGKGSALLAAGLMAAAFAGNTYEHSQSPIRMPEGARYLGEQDRHVEKWEPELFIAGPKRDYGTDQPVQVWEIDIDTLHKNIGKMSCGEDTDSVLGIEMSNGSSDVEVDPLGIVIDLDTGEDYWADTATVWCDREGDHPVEYFSDEMVIASGIIVPDEALQS